jgi:hypothetical protein
MNLFRKYALTVYNKVEVRMKASGVPLIPVKASSW